MARSKLRSGLACVAVLATAWLFFTCGHCDDAVAPPAATPGAATKPTPHPKPRSHAVPDDPTPAPAVADAAPAAHDDVPEDDAFPFVDVEVVNADGTPAPDAVVYATPAGKPFVGPEEPTNAALVDGRRRLHVLRRGLYDVGAYKEEFAALAEGVDVPRAGPLRITLPAPARVLVRFEQPLVPSDPTWPGADIQIQPAGDDIVNIPGRGQRRMWSVEGRMDAKVTEWGATVPAGPCIARLFDNEGLVASPYTFTAPAEVRVRHVERFAMQLDVAFEPADAVFAHAVRADVRFFVDDSPRMAGAWTLSVAANQRVADAKDSRVVLYAGAAAMDGTIRWKGPGVVAASTEFHGLRRDADNVIKVKVRVDESPPAQFPPFPEAVLQASVVADAHAAGGPSKSQVNVSFVADDGSAASVQCGPDKIPALVKSGARWALAARGDWTADVVAVDPTAKSASVAFVVAPGGYVVPQLERRLPPELGEVRLRRKDGAAFLTTDAEGFVGGVVSTPTKRGLALGPFPPGDVVFVAEICGEPVGELRAVVRAGERTPLTIPRFGAK
jgi:hypothetical protein